MSSIRIKSLLFATFLFCVATIIIRPIYSASSHLQLALTAQKSEEKIQELKRAALFTSPFNHFATEAMQRLEQEASSSEAAQRAHCDAIFGARHPLLNLGIPAYCENLPQSFKIVSEHRINFLGNLLTPLALGAWLLSTVFLIFRGFTAAGTPTTSFKALLFLSVLGFASYLGSLLL